MTTTLKEQTNALLAEYQQKLPEDVMGVIFAATEKLVNSGIGNSCLQSGDKIPNFSLPDAYGRSVSIRSYLEKGPVVISFYRGAWCTFCNLELKALQERLDDIRQAGAELIAITPQKPDSTRETLQELEINYPILTDKGNQVAHEFGLVFQVDESLKPIYEDFLALDLPGENGDDSYQLPVTATYVIDQEGVIAACFTDPNFTNRMEPEKIIESVKEIMTEKMV